MLLAMAMATSLASPPSTYFTDNLIYALEQTQGELVMYAKCDESKGHCYARMETYEAWFKCDIFTFQCVVTKTKKLEQSI